MVDKYIIRGRAKNLSSTVQMFKDNTKSVASGKKPQVLIESY